MMQKNKSYLKNKGFSMLELIIAFAIMSVIVVIVGSAMSNSSKTYSRLSADATLQSEAQLVANFITNKSIDAYKAQNTIPDDVSLPDDYTSGGEECLVLESIHTNNSGTIEKNRYIIVRDKVNKKLNLFTQSYDDTNNKYGTLGTASVIGDHITAFSADTDRVEKDNIIKFSLGLEKVSKKYAQDYQVYMRNKEYVDKAGSEKPPADIELKRLTLTPKIVYVDVKNDTFIGYHKDLINEDSPISYITPIEFTAKAIYNGSVSDEMKKSDWKLIGEDSSLVTISSDKAEKVNLNMKSTGFFSSAVDKFNIKASIGDISQTSKILIRMVKKVSLSSPSPTKWNEKYEKRGYDGRQYATTDSNEEIDGYVLPSSSVTVSASVDCHNISPELSWKLYYKKFYDKNDSSAASGEWRECTNDSLAKLAVKEVSNKTVNTVVLGRMATNEYVFKVVATSTFDPTATDMYIFGVFPQKLSTSDGFNSRGFYLNMSDYFRVTNQAPQGDYPKVSRILDIECSPGSNFDKGGEAIKKAFKWNPDTQELFIDYEVFQYGSLQSETFYKTFELNMSIDYIGLKTENGVEKEVIVQTINPGSAEGQKRLKGYQDAYNIESTFTGGAVFHYQVYGVKVNTPDKGYNDSKDEANNILCVAKGKSAEFDMKFNYFNITNRKQVGLYAKGKSDSNFTDNLNESGKSGLFKYISASVSSAYGTVNDYVDELSIKIEPKVFVKEYPSDYLVIRTTLDPFYNTNKNNGDSYCDYRVYIANLDGKNIFIPGPNTTAASADNSNNVNDKLCWPSNITSKSDKTKFTVKGVDTSNKVVEAKVYKDGNNYFCTYDGTTYKYNKSYNYWQKTN